jgi:hypothetical protein
MLRDLAVDQPGVGATSYEEGAVCVNCNDLSLQMAGELFYNF